VRESLAVGGWAMVEMRFNALSRSFTEKQERKERTSELLKAVKAHVTDHESLREFEEGFKE
jgi:hypothetical protein